MKYYLLPLLAVSAISLSGCAENSAFKAADTDNDGRISPIEFERYMLEAIYSAADTDGDARVTLQEYKTAYPSRTKSDFDKVAGQDSVITPQDAKAFSQRQGTMNALFKKIDSNGDGFLEEAEIKAFYAKACESAGATDLEKLSNAAAQ